MANFNFNKVILGGRLTADPELKTTPSGIAVTTFNIAVNRRFADKQTGENTADFFTVQAWRQTAEFITKYFRKASSICIVGSIQTRSWVGQDGQKKYATEIVADEAYFVDAKNEMLAGTAYSPAGAANAAGGTGTYPQTNTAPQGAYIPQDYQTQATPTFENLSDEEELPF